MTRPIAGTPSLLRAINDRAALMVLLERGPLTRPELGALTGLSKPTASQLLARLQEAGLVVLDGIREGLPGRTAELYRINPRAAHVAALDVTPARIAAAVADVTGAVVAEHRLATPGRAGGDVVERVRAALTGACGPAGLDPTELSRVVVGIGGAVDPSTGRLGYAAHIPGWHIPDLIGTLRDGIGVPIDVENDVNLVAQAERSRGSARGHQDYVLLWADEGIGAALVIGGRLHRGATGGAGEVGYMPVVGAPTARDVGRRPTTGSRPCRAARPCSPSCGRTGCAAPRRAAPYATRPPWRDAAARTARARARPCASSPAASRWGWPRSRPWSIPRSSCCRAACCSPAARSCGSRSSGSCTRSPSPGLACCFPPWRATRSSPEPSTSPSAPYARSCSAL